MERRSWKADLSKKAQERNARKLSLLVELDQTREQIKQCGLDFARYDEIKAEQRRIAAELATL